MRLDQKLVELSLVATRSQAESYIKLGKVRVDGKVVTKPGATVNDSTKIKLLAKDQYVSRAALKLGSITKALKLDFKGKVVLDVGSSTGGFTDFALRHGAKKVIAVDTGTDQLHPTLRNNERIELHEQTDIRDFVTQGPLAVDLVLVDVSFISMRKILPSVHDISTLNTQIIAMVKPQFETHESSLKNRGVIKNERIRRQIFKDFEIWVTKLFKVINKADSQVSGEKGNLERFYMLKKL